MPVIRNVAPVGALDVPLIGAVVEHGEEVTVSAEHASALLAQRIFEAVDDEAKAIVARIEADEKAAAAKVEEVIDPAPEAATPPAQTDVNATPDVDVTGEPDLNAGEVK